jgi:hypothetical protein
LCLNVKLIGALNFGGIDNAFVIPYNVTMNKQIIKDSIVIGLLIVSILFIFVVAIPFVMSDEFVGIALSLIGR